MNKKKKTENPELSIIQGLGGKYPLTLPSRKVYRAKDILRIQSQLISGFIRGEIESEPAKTLSYLCNTFLTSLQFAEFETRLENIERETKGKSNEHKAIN